MNKINILRMTAENISLFNDGKFDFDLTNRIQISNFNDDHAYYNLKSTIYLPKTVVIKGVNASGKTTILKMVELIFLMFLEKLNLNHNYIAKYLDMFYDDKPMMFTLFYTYNNKLYKIESTIDLTSEQDEKNKYMFKNEKIYEKSLTTSLSKVSLYESGYKLIQDRSNLDSLITTFLSNDETINEMILLGTDFVLNTHLQKDDELYYSSKRVRPLLFKSLDPAIISFLDPSIKKIEPNYVLNEDNIRLLQRNLTYNLHLANGKKIEVSTIQLEQMLSSGTLRGLNLLTSIKTILKNGGYIIIDELELHLNKSIIVDIIRLFKGGDTNPKNATLIFTTHYTEILDIFDRNDQIFFSHRNKNYEMMLSNYSDYNKLSHLKKSDFYFADTYNLGTAISYDKYYALRKSFKDQHND